MKAYKFYLRDEMKNWFDIVGLLPERRMDPERITDESIINWGRKYFGTNVKDKAMFFIEILLPEGKVRVTEYLNGIIHSLLMAGIAIAVGLIVAHIG
jgi:hypothetical protein